MHAPEFRPEFWANRDSGLARLLQPLACAWTLAGRARRALARPSRVPVPVICIGNLVAGGAGKTPVTIALARALVERGVAVHILTRGYGGREAGPLCVDPARHGFADVGDEALLLAREAPTWLARDRVAGAKAAVELGAKVILMDDGFQNPSLTKDLSFIVIDGGFGFGNGRVMPAGPLRELLTDGLARANAAILIGKDDTGVATALPASLSLHRARFVPEAGGEAIAGRAVVAFAGIGRPEKFFATVKALGATIKAAHAFPDHHPYTPDEVMRLVEAARAADAVLITTDKDAVRLPPEARAMVHVLKIALAWDDPANPDRLITPILDRLQ
ncbi:MAG: tetraacyldisaccharide 4'-kinase [Alphaproteobacteria bacterium]